MTLRVLSLALLVGFSMPVLALSEAELESIGRRVWKNECGGTVEGLTSWNEGEGFASLGIGHFIWYPKGVDGPYEESFPPLLKFLSEHGRKLPGWLTPSSDCPWNSRAEFRADAGSAKMKELRAMLAETVPLQSQFLAQRMEAALPKMLAEAPAGKREHVKKQFQRLAATGKGTFALIDYVNFKGEGTNPAERYKGEGCGAWHAATTTAAHTNWPLFWGGLAGSIALIWCWFAWSYHGRPHADPASYIPPTNPPGTPPAPEPAS